MSKPFVAILMGADSDLPQVQAKDQKLQNQLKSA